MKKLLFLFTCVFTLFLVSCNPFDKNELSDEEITEKIEEFMEADSYEAKMRARIVTEELEIKANPLLTYQLYTDSDEQQVLRVHYYNKLMEGAGLEAFELIVDESNEKVYINNTEAWYYGSFNEIEDEAGQPFFNYFFNSEEHLDSKELEEVKIASTIISEGIKTFNDARYIEEIDIDGRTLIHYEVDYNIYRIANDLYNEFNENERLGYANFREFIDEVDIEEIAELFKEFTIDLYFEADDDHDLARIEIDFMHILSNDLILEKIEETIDSEEIDIEVMLEYLKDLEIAVDIYDINSLDDIEIPEEAKNGHPYTLIDAPLDLDPDEVTIINLGSEHTYMYTEDSNTKWYKFTLGTPSSVHIQSDSAVDPSMVLYDANLNKLAYEDDLYSGDDHSITSYDFYYNDLLEAGTYYFEITSYQPGTVKITIE